MHTYKCTIPAGASGTSPVSLLFSTLQHLLPANKTGSNKRGIMTKTIVKRDGRTEAFDVAKIKAAIEAAMVAVHKGLTGDLAQKAVQLSEQIAQITEDGASI